MLVKRSAVVLIALLLWGCAGAATPVSDGADAGKLVVISTVSPLVNIIYNIGGEHIALTGIVPEGTNSHTFEPAPSDAKLLADADIIFVNGLSLEDPTLKLAEANKRADTPIVKLGEQTIKPDEYLYDFSFPKDGGHPNPHLWTNPLLGLRYAEIVKDTLVERDPANAASYQANFASYKTRLEELDTAIKATIESIPPSNRKLLTYHDSWAYFAPHYGMTVIGAIQPADFSEPSAREIAGLIEQIRQEQVPAIFGSEVFPSPILEQIAAETGSTYVDDLRDDDLPGAPGDATHSYIGLIVEDVRIMAAALGGNPDLIAAFDTRNLPGADGAVQQSQ